MTNPTRQEIIAAHDALEILYDLVEVLSFTDSETCLARKHCASVLAALPPRPQLTMADVEWDDEEHYLAEAKSLFHGNVVMIEKDTEDGLIQCISAGGIGGVFVTPPEALTLTGKRYILTEVQE